MLKILLFLTLLQPDTATVNFTEVRRVSISAEQFTTDDLGNCFLIRKDQITKYNSSGDSLLSQSYKTLGQITSMDAMNSMRLLVFYRDLNQVMILDNTLSMQGEPVKLEKNGFPFTRLICQSTNNNQLWIYDTDEFRLLRLDRNFQIVQNTGNITQLTGQDLDPNFMLEAGNMLYLNDPKTGILVFDMFGSYFKTIPLKELTEFQIVDNFIYHLRDDQLFRYDMVSFLTDAIPLPMKGIRSFRLVGKKLFLLTENELGIFLHP